MEPSAQPAQPGPGLGSLAEHAPELYNLTARLAADLEAIDEAAVHVDESLDVTHQLVESIRKEIRSKLFAPEGPFGGDNKYHEQIRGWFEAARTVENQQHEIYAETLGRQRRRQNLEQLGAAEIDADKAAQVARRAIYIDALRAFQAELDRLVKAFDQQTGA
jgi:hypothetical protein